MQRGAHACQAVTRLSEVCSYRYASKCVLHISLLGVRDTAGRIHLVVVCDCLAGTAKVVVGDVEHLAPPSIVVVVCMGESSKSEPCLNFWDLQFQLSMPA
jgi:hypothetical protein